MLTHLFRVLFLLGASSIAVADAADSDPSADFGGKDNSNDAYLTWLSSSSYDHHAWLESDRKSTRLNSSHVD